MMRQSHKRSAKNDNTKYFSKISNNFDSDEDYITVYKYVAAVLNKMDIGTVGFKEAFSKTEVDQTIIYHVYAIALKAVNNLKLCKRIVNESGILEENPDKDKNLIVAIVADLLWGYKRVVGRGAIFDIVRKKQKLLEELNSTHGGFREKFLNVVFVRVNTAKYSTEEFFEYLNASEYRYTDTPSTYQDFLKAVRSMRPTRFMVDYHFKDLFVFHAKAKSFLWASDVLQSKRATIQDKSSLMAVNLLNVEPGSTVLDMCAAPGMKTVYLAARLNGNGKILAVDRDKKRFQSLTSLVKSFGVENLVDCYNFDVSHFKCDNDSIDFVLLDAPCSGSGIRDRTGETDCSQNRLQSLHWLQVKLLTQALTQYPRAKRILYSTCSTTVEENESVVEEALGKCGDDLNFDLVDCHRILDGFSTGSDEFESGCYCLRTDMKRDYTNGFFIALFERKTQEENIERKKNKKNKRTVIEETNNRLEDEEEAIIKIDTGKEGGGVENTEDRKKKKKKNKKNKRIASEETNDRLEDEEEVTITIDTGKDDGVVENTEDTKKKKKKNKKNKRTVIEETNDRLEDEEEAIITIDTGKEEGVVENTEDTKKKKKKSKKNKRTVVEETNDRLEGEEEAIITIDTGKEDGGVEKTSERKKNKKKNKRSDYDNTDIKEERSREKNKWEETNEQLQDEELETIKRDGETDDTAVTTIRKRKKSVSEIERDNLTKKHKKNKLKKQS